ncbi:MAG: hypothetical protein HZB26_10495 [Candidatus Hydrogenedentes bacterium]|nr:hypothetical protein [Candidatus Hydrogenedentota bacterium]
MAAAGASGGAGPYIRPGPVSALMSGVVIKTGIYGLLRLISWLPNLPAGCAIGLMVVSVATGVLGILYALGQQQIKRMLAYSSVENMGVIGLGISVALLGRSLQQPLLIVFGLGGALFHVLNHSLFKGLLFLSAGAVLHDTGTGDIERLGGLARRSPVNSLAFLVGAVAICALPPLNGFVSEYVIYTGLLQGLLKTPNLYAGLLASSTAALALVGGLALAAFSKVFGVVFLGSPRDCTVTVHATPRTMNAGMLLLALCCVAVAAFAGAIVPALGAAIGAVMPAASAQLNEIHEAVTFTTRLALPFGVLMAIGFALYLLRRRTARGAVADQNTGTWGCGYAFPSPSMQYTGSSYGWKLVHSFRQIIRPERAAPRIAGFFPEPARLDTATPDLALNRVYTPSFKWMARAFERLWPLQQGRIQLYLAYIVITVLVVFLFEAWPFSFTSQSSDGRAVAVTNAPNASHGADSSVSEPKGRHP